MDRVREGCDAIYRICPMCVLCSPTLSCTSLYMVASGLTCRLFFLTIQPPLYYIFILLLHQLGCNSLYFLGYTTNYLILLYGCLIRYFQIFFLFFFMEWLFCSCVPICLVGFCYSRHTIYSSIPSFLLLPHINASQHSGHTCGQDGEPLTRLGLLCILVP